MIEVSGVFSLFLPGVLIISDVIDAKSSSCKEKLDISLLYLVISISVGFLILLLILDKLVPVIDLDLSPVLTVSVL